MPSPMKIRAQVRDGVADIRILMAHDMETGQRRDASGALVPAWYIHEVVATINGKPVMKAHWGPAISKNPYLQFKVRGVNVGDKLVVTWVDTKGEKRSDEAAFTAA